MAVKKKRKIGTIPGSIEFTGRRKVEKIEIQYLEYNMEVLNEEILSNQSIKEFYHPSDKVVQWYDIRGLHDEKLIAAFGDIFNIHPLVLEDIVDVNQRPKYDELENGILIVLHALYYNSSGKINKELVSIYLGEGFVLTFQEGSTDLFQDVRQRIHTSKGRIKQKKTDYLAFALLDCIVDNYFRVLDEFSEKIDIVEDKIYEQADEPIKGEIHLLKYQGIRMKKSIFPLREAISKFARSDHNYVHDNTIPFIRDVYENTIQIMDTVETNRDIITGLQDLYITEISFRMNKVMQVLTIVTTIFVPLSFLAGIYGMNFNHMPELQYHYGYYALWSIMIIIAIVLLLYFKRKKWL